MANDTDKALVASSEFDPSSFIKGIDAMTASLQKFSQEEDNLNADIANINTALKSNRAELKATTDQINALDKSSKTYADDLKRLTDQQTVLKNQQSALNATMKQNQQALKDVNAAANEYRGAIQNISAISKQVAQENKGRTLFDVASLNQQIAEVTELGGKLRNVFNGKIDTRELDRFEQELAQTDDEFKQLAQVIDFVKSKMDTLDPNSQEFADLNKVIETGEQVLEQYGETVEKTDKKSVSLRGQLKVMREELARLEEQGKDNTKEFEDLQVAAGQLQDQIGDTQQRIKVLSSDTKNLDFGIGAIRGVASAFGVAEGAAALFGIKNEDVAQSIQRLNAIMLILNGLQEIQNLLQKQSVVSIVGQEIATKAAAIAQRVYAVAVGTSTGAMKAFRVALLATGIGAFVVLLGLAADAMGLFGSSTEDATDDSKKFTEALEDTQRALQSTTDWLKFNQQVQEERLKRGNATEEQFSKQRIKTLNDERDALRKAYGEIRDSQDDFLNSGLSGGDFIEKANQEATRIANRIIDIGDELILENEKSLTKRYQDTQKKLEKERQLYEAYLARLIALQREYRDKVLAANPQDEAAIREQFKNSLSDALADLDKEVSDGKLTKKRAGMLAKLVRQINTVDLNAALKEFRDDAVKAEEELSNTIQSLRLRNGQESAELIRDQFTREAALVRVESRKQSVDLQKERDELIRSINETRDQGLISPEAAKENVARVTEIYQQLLQNLAEQTTRKQEEITARVFEAAQDNLRTIFANVQLFVSDAATAEIEKVTNRFLSGQIKYATYQKELTRIAEEESRRRIATAIRENEALLKGVQDRIKAEQDPERLKALQDQERQLRLTINDLKRQELQANAEGEQKDQQARGQRIQELAQYAQAIGGIISQVVQFWAAANQAEQQSLERSIALQERRVEAATRLAERGNAEYLRLEEDRLNELQVKQENAARRQLAINAVLQTSQALTAFITALAQGIATGGPLGGIAIAGAVIGLIASGYAIISNLQKQNTQTLFKGSKKVKRNGEPTGIDTIPAMLTEGEAVIPVDQNKAYHPAVSAIYDKSIPAEDMNAFVNSYHANRRVLPRLDHGRMGEVADVMVTYDGRLMEATERQTAVLEQHTEMLKKVDHRLKTMGVSFNFDKNGVQLMLLKGIEQAAIDKKV